MRRAFFLFWGAATLSCGTDHHPGALQAPLPANESTPVAENEAALAGTAVTKITTRLSPGPCLKGIDIQFDRSINLQTLYGKLLVRGNLDAKRALVVESWGSGFRNFSLAVVGQPLCDDFKGYNRIVLQAGVRDTSGNELQQELSWPLNLANDNSNQTMAGQGQWRSRSAPCAGGTCLRVTAADLNRAATALKAWETQERQQPHYKQGLHHLPFHGTILREHHEVNRKHQYGSAATNFTLRRAAVFTKLLFPELKEIRVADLSDPDGSTPSVTMGGKVIYTHPGASHRGGEDADVTYLGLPGNINWEANFWYLYAVLDSTGIDILITAYRDEFFNMAKQAYEQGLIHKIAWARFNKLKFDDGLNHDQHFHAGIRHKLNQGQTPLFKPYDHVYSCFQNLSTKYRGLEQDECTQ